MFQKTYMNTCIYTINKVKKIFAQLKHRAKLFFHVKMSNIHIYCQPVFIHLQKYSRWINRLTKLFVFLQITG